jgi:hypothetical protein
VFALNRRMTVWFTKYIETYFITASAELTGLGIFVCYTTICIKFSIELLQVSIYRTLVTLFELTY